MHSLHNPFWNAKCFFPGCFSLVLFLFKMFHCFLISEHEHTQIRTFINYGTLNYLSTEQRLMISNYKESLYFSFFIYNFFVCCCCLFYFHVVVRIGPKIVFVRFVFMTLVALLNLGNWLEIIHLLFHFLH